MVLPRAIMKTRDLMQKSFQDKSRTPDSIRKNLSKSKSARQLDFLVPRKRIPLIERQFREFLANYSNGAFERLPKKEFYYDIFFKCYFSLGQQQRLNNNICPTHQLCEIPKVPNLKCSIASVPYSYASLSNVTLHYRIAHGNFRISSHGC